LKVIWKWLSEVNILNEILWLEYFLNN